MSGDELYINGKVSSGTNGGGGGGEWEVVESRIMTGNALELFTVGTDDVIKIVIDGMRYGGDGDSFPNISLSVDGGSTYPNTHKWSALENAAGTTTPHGQGANTSTSFWLYDAISQRDTADGEIILTGITNASSVTIARRFNYLGYDVGGFSGQQAGGGVFETNGTVNKIKVAAQGGNTMTAGKITLLKRTY